MSWSLIVAVLVAIFVILLYLFVTRLSVKEIRNISFTEYYQEVGG